MATFPRRCIEMKNKAEKACQGVKKVGKIQIAPSARAVGAKNDALILKVGFLGSDIVKSFKGRNMSDLKPRLDAWVFKSNLIEDDLWFSFERGGRVIEQGFICGA